jgi:ribosomal protein L7/L12
MPQPFNCPTCGAPLNYKGGPDLTINCSFCGTPVIVPPELRTGPIVEPPAPTSAAPLTVSQRPEFAEIERLVRAGKKIDAIKLFRGLTGAGLKEAKDAIDKIDRGDASAAANYAAAAGALKITSSTPDRAGQIEKIGRLLNAGNKIEAIKVYRETFGVGLKEAKDAVEKLQTTVGTPGAFDLHPTTVSSSSHRPDRRGAGRRPLRPPPSIKRLKDQSAKLKQIGDNVRAGNKTGAARVLSEIFDLGEAQADDLVDMLADGKTVKIGNVTLEVAKESLDSPVVEPARPRVGGCLAALALVIVAAVAAWFALNANGGDNQIVRAFRNLSPTATAVPTVAPQPTEAPAPTQVPPPSPAPTSTPGVLNVTQILLGGFGTGHGLFENAHSLAVDGAGNIYVGEYEGGLVQVFDETGEYLTEWRIDGGGFLKKLAADKDGVVFAVFNGDIYKYDGATGELLGQLSYDGGQGFQDVAVTADGGLAATWNKDWQGGLFVNFSESQDDLVMFDGEGNVTRVISKILSVEANGYAELETLIAVDGEGNIYLTGLNNDGIFKFTPEGKFVGEFGAYEVAYATAIAADDLGRVFVSASGVIYIFDAEGRSLGFEDVTANGIVVVDEDRLLVLNHPQVWEYTLNERP